MSKTWTYHSLYVHPSSGAAVTATIIRVMLSRFGLRKTMLIKTGVDAVVLGTAYLLIRERRKPSTAIIWYDKRFLTDPIFWSVTLCLCLANFGYPAPFFYLPTFAKQKVPNLTELVSVKYDGILATWETHHLQQLSVLPVTILNISSGIGRCCVGFFADRIGPTNAMFAVVLISGLTQLLVWNFVSDYPGIVRAFEQCMDPLDLTLHRWLCRCYTVSSGSASGL